MMIRVPAATAQYQPGYGGALGRLGDAASDAAIAQAINSGLTQAEQIYLQSEGPGVIPGTNLVYNPATGQVINPSAVTIGSAGQAVNTALGGISPVMILGFGALIVTVVLMANRK